MICKQAGYLIAWLAAPALLFASVADAHKLREHGLKVAVAASSLSVTPTRDWNRLGIQLGKNTEIWTIDGEQLNEVTFYGGIDAGKPLVRERSKKRDPLPKVGKDMLPVEIPELLEGTYRTYKAIGAFKLLSTEPTKFLGGDGVIFNYEYIDKDQLTRQGEARAVMIHNKLYMITFDAPRLHYYGLGISQFRALADTATLS